MEFVLCCVCGMPESCCKLVRLTWVPCGCTVEMRVAKVRKDNDVLVCVNCIKGIKRIPFSDLPADVEIPF